MKYGQQVLQQKPVSEWLNGPDADKIVKVDVYEPGYPAMYLTNGAFLSGSGLSLNGTASNLATTPDSSAISVTGDIDIQMKLTCNDWQGSLQGFIGKWGTAGNRSYTIYTQNGFFRTVFSNDGTAEIFADSTNYSITNGATKWIRFTMDVNDGLGNRVFKYYTSDDGSSWTQLGTTTTVAGTTNIFDSGSVLSIGTSGRAGIFPLGSQSSLATFHRLIIRNGYDGAGSVVFDANFEAQQYGASSFLESSSNAATVSIQSTAVWQSQWSLPAGATFVKVLCVGGGGGGGSGRKGAAGTNRGGGGGGGSGGVSFAEFAASAFTSSVTVTVGAGGSGAAARTTNSTNGINGSTGSATTFGSFCGAAGGGAGSAGAQGQNNPAAAAAGLYAAQGGDGVPDFGSVVRRPATILVAGGAGGTGVIGATETAYPNYVGIAGLTIGSDVPAVRNFASGSGAAGSTGVANAGSNGQTGCGGGGGGNGTDNVSDSGAGGNGGAGLCVVVSYRDVDIQEFTASGTWNRPVGDYTLAKIFVVGAGGGGGSGRRGAAGTDRGGGEAGGGGSITCITVPFSQLGTSETVTVGLGGTGGSGASADDTNGTSGNTGGQSSFGTLATANGGGLGLGAGQSGWSSIKTVAGFSFPGGANGQGSFTAGTAGAGANSYTGGGGAGGAINASNTNRAGGAGGVGAAYTSAVSAAAAGTSATSIATAAGFYGGNGGGGGAAPANSGGNGASKGGGGGGGGGSLNGTNSGAGGNGGDGYVCVVCV